MDYTSWITPDKESCDCYNGNYDKMKNKDLATAYIPKQVLDKVYPIQEALVKGTAFPELYK